MTLIKGRRTVVKLVVAGVFVVALATISMIGRFQKINAASSGPSPAFSGAPGESNCTACHADYEVNSGAGLAQISGVPANYAPGQQIQVTVTVSQSDATIYGFELTAIDTEGRKAGTITLSPEMPAQTQIVLGSVKNEMGVYHEREYIEHTSDGLIPTAFGSKSWTFTWTAPSPPVGRVDFYVAGNAANSDLSPSGDYIYTATVSSVPVFSVSGRVSSPVGTGLRNALVSITGPSGMPTTTLTSPFGQYSFSNIPAGNTYTLRVSSKRYRFAAQNVTVKGDLTEVNFVGQE